MLRVISPAQLIDGADCKLRIVRRRQFANKHDVEPATKAPRNNRRHGHGAPRDRGDQWIAAAPLPQRIGEQLACFFPIAKNHHAPAPRLISSETVLRHSLRAVRRARQQ
jgi:hypothetical protein